MTNAPAACAVPRNDLPATLLVGLLADFGSLGAWRSSFLGEVARSMGAPGRVALELSVGDGRLRNRRHGPLGASPFDAGSVALLTRKTSGATEEGNRFVDSIDWTEVGQRYQQAVYAASANLATDALASDGALFLDVRRGVAFKASDRMIEGATWYDPTLIESWAGAVAVDRPVIAYCVAGHELSRKVAIRMQSLGLSASFLAGGIDGWMADGRRTATKSQVRPEIASIRA